MAQRFEPKPIPFAVGSYKSASPVVSAQRVVNAYAEVQKPSMQPRSSAVLFGSPGLAEFVEVGSGPIRAMIYFQPSDCVYLVSGSTMYELQSDGTTTPLGSGIRPGLDVLAISENGTTIQVCDGTKAFNYTPGTLTYAQVSDTDFPGASTVTYINSYFMHAWDGTNKFFSSDSNDATSYDPLFYSQADTQSDNVLAPLNFRQQLYIGGERSIEIWQFVPGASNFPWARFPGASINIGLAGKFAAKVHKEAIYFVGSDLIFYRLDGSTPVPISDPAIAIEWQEYTTTNDVFLFSMTWGIQEWIVITFPSENKTWVFDATTGLFHERESFDEAGVSLGRWRANCYCKAWNRHLIGDAYDSRIGYLDRNTYEEYGNTLLFKAVSPIMHADGAVISLASLEFIVETGVGLTEGQGVDPQIMLRWSDDGGQTWSTTQPSRSMGGIGQYQRRVRFGELGSFQNRCFEVSISDPVKRVVVSVVPKPDIGVSYA